MFTFYLHPPMLLGYARVSTAEQNLALQQDALQRAGCQKIISDTISGTRSERPGLTRLREQLREGDTLVIWRLDRLGRSLQDLIGWAQYLEANGIALRSLQEAIDTSTPAGRLVFHMFGALAEFERNLIRERTEAGLAAARARGRKGGRPRSLGKDKRRLVVQLYNGKQHTLKQIMELMGISKQTIYNIVEEETGHAAG